MSNSGRVLPAVFVAATSFALGAPGAAVAASKARAVRNIYARPRMIGLQVSFGAAQ